MGRIPIPGTPTLPTLPGSVPRAALEFSRSIFPLLWFLMGCQDRDFPFLSFAIWPDRGEASPSNARVVSKGLRQALPTQILPQPFPVLFLSLWEGSTWSLPQKQGLEPDAPGNAASPARLAELEGPWLPGKPWELDIKHPEFQWEADKKSIGLLRNPTPQPLITAQPQCLGTPTLKVSPGWQQGHQRDS